MLTKPTLEELLPRAENRYVLAMFTSKRARQLTDGARALKRTNTKNQVSVACEEIAAGAVVYRRGKYEDVVIPERPEIIAQREASRREAEAKRAEDMLEEQRRPLRRSSKKQSSTFEKEGISAQEASLIAEQLVQFVNKQENKKDPEIKTGIDFEAFSESLDEQEERDKE